MYISNISDAQSQLAALIERVISGDEVIIGDAGKPVAKIIPYKQSVDKRVPGALKGQIKISDDFDELPDEIAQAFGISK